MKKGYEHIYRLKVESSRKTEKISEENAEKQNIRIIAKEHGQLDDLELDGGVELKKCLS